MSGAWRGVGDAAGIPEPVRGWLVAACRQAVGDPELVAAMQRSGSQARELSGDAFAAAVKQEVSDLRELNKKLRLALE